MTDSRAWLPHVTVASIIERDGRFLFVEEKSRGQTVLNQPAGHLEPDESLIEACARETLEETGWQFKPEHLVGIYHFTGSNGTNYLRFLFSGKLGTQIHEAPTDPKIIRTHWLTEEELNAQFKLRSYIVNDCISDYNKGIVHPLSLLSYWTPKNEK